MKTYNLYMTDGTKLTVTEVEGGNNSLLQATGFVEVIEQGTGRTLLVNNTQIAIAIPQ